MKKRSLREVRLALSVNRQGPSVGFVVPIPTVVKILSGSIYRYSYQAATCGGSVVTDLKRCNPEAIGMLLSNHSAIHALGVWPTAPL